MNYPYNHCRVMKRSLITIILLVLGGCCSEGASPAYITYFLNKDYDGRPANQFFADYGYPAGAFERTNGTTVYLWASSRDKVQPRKAAPTDFISAHGNLQMVDTYHGVTARQYCEIRIVTDTADNITDFLVAVDSTGKWSTSRCSEIFN